MYIFDWMIPKQDYSYTFNKILDGNLNLCGRQILGFVPNLKVNKKLMTT